MAKMADAEIARADAEYDALPGTPPNGYSFRSNAEIEGRDRAELFEEMRALHERGRFFRLTKTDDGLWLEAWDERPFKQAKFNPPYTTVAPNPHSKDESDG